MSKKRLVIAVDGTAASGKSTVARILARRLRYRYVDSGLLYRALAWKSLRVAAHPCDARAMAALARSTRLELKTAGQGAQHVFVDAKRVTALLHREPVTARTKEIAAIKEVREILRHQQRAMKGAGGIVVAGRDIGTVVFPEADAKFFLDASLKERARRRFKEQKQREKNITLKKIENALRRRDAEDRRRRHSPLRRAADAVAIDTTEKTPSQVVDVLLEQIKKKSKL